MALRVVVVTLRVVMTEMVRVCPYAISVARASS